MHPAYGRGGVSVVETSGRAPVRRVVPRTSLIGRTRARFVRPRRCCSGGDPGKPTTAHDTARQGYKYACPSAITTHSCAGHLPSLHLYSLITTLVPTATALSSARICRSFESPLPLRRPLAFAAVSNHRAASSFAAAVRFGRRLDVPYRFFPSPHACFSFRALFLPNGQTQKTLLQYPLRS